MIKMYHAEVLGKLPVIQHFFFGSILTWDGPFPDRGDHDHEGSHCGHDHAEVSGQNQVGWGDCCGIPVPSVFAAANAEKDSIVTKLSGPGIRPVPFD
jgi:serine/threonine-protein phosphatase 2A activator